MDELARLSRGLRSAPLPLTRRATRTTRTLAGLLLASVALITSACAGRATSSRSSEASPSDPVRTRQGLLSGTTTDRPGVRAYLGVPFAAPPVGDLRWRAPRAAASWGGVRAASQFSPSCVQAPPVPFGPWTKEFLLRGPVSEDCLYLNVWSAARQSERRPVFIWVYGGGFGSGSGDVPVYDGARLAEKGLVVISINYRVGALGFLAHPELTAEAKGASGNYGLMDQVAALEWVRDNVAAFGGDPRNITVAGQSAGAMSVFLLTASPMAKGLFQRAVIESGPGGLAAMGVSTSRTVARPRVVAEAEGVGYGATKSALTLADLRALPASMFIGGNGGARFGPVVDGRFLVEDPAATFAAGRQNDVPTLTGLNADEGSASPAYGKATADFFRKQAEQRFGESASRFLALYPAESDSQARRSQIESGRDLGLIGVQRLLEERARSARTPSFAYYFDRAIPWPERPEFGAFHTAEVPYVFGTLDALVRPWTAVDRRLSETMMSYWTNFATRGDPNGDGLPTWPAFSASQPVIMELGERIGPRAPVAADRASLLLR